MPIREALVIAEDGSIVQGYYLYYPPAQSDTYVKATTKYSTSYWPYFATDPSKPLTGGWVGTVWLSQNGVYTNQRFHIDLGASYSVNTVYYENVHSVGGNITLGVKNFTIWGSNLASSFDSVATYSLDTGWTLMATSSYTQTYFNKHVAANRPDPNFIQFDNGGVDYRYWALKFDDGWVASNFMGVKRIVMAERRHLVVNVDMPYTYYMSGGTETSIGDELILTFTSNGVLTVTGTGTASVLVVGGGSGGNKPATTGFGGGGGGGGAVVYQASISLSTGTYSIIIGSGGSGASSVGGIGGNGGNTRFISGGSDLIIATGSQAGSANTIQDYGNNSGTTLVGGGTFLRDLIALVGGQGGGSSAVGSDGIINGSGTNGVDSAISGSTIGYGGGGGGGVAMAHPNTNYSGGSVGADGGGGGGGIASSAPTNPSAGLANRGGGGGGGAVWQSSGGVRTYTNGANGGSGVVIIRYTPV